MTVLTSSFSDFSMYLAQQNHISVCVCVGGWGAVCGYWICISSHFLVSLVSVCSCKLLLLCDMTAAYKLTDAM